MLSARSGALPFVQHSYAGLHSTSGVSGVRLRFAPADTRHALSSATAFSALLHSLCAPSVARKSGVRHCFAEPGVICAVSANAVRLAFSLGRQHFRSFSIATHGGTTLRRVDAVASLRSDHRIHAPTLRIRHPPLSFTLSMQPWSLGQKAVSGTATQSRALFVRCRLTPSAWRSRSVGSTSVRSASLRMAELRSGGWMRWLRFAQITASTLLRFASAILRSASLSPCSLGRSVKKRCPALLRRAGRYLCGVG